MQYEGFVIHHSACPSINGKGYDFMILRSGDVVPAPALTDPHYIHLCIEGDFSRFPPVLYPSELEQLFIARKLIARLSEVYRIPLGNTYSHDGQCPGLYFPWNELVISGSDGYH
ncbi:MULTISPECIES: N-acetylmuramoyl-L-alanine amidase [unclassified Paenibacillus]|uniref:peptidoglycan recognition protein family protein n=1 Tax=unclassified Paenibacillus TaxID=185978 RepID=UPI001C0F7C62|nr:MULTISPECIES: N-acetylmuramoyl-L-alanine amidase [unclassified Paenibacillus]MBU5444095.1 N-acetylmuramoyl-L-alanine amidase [Paenibacillus sp. MSJ-34]CAH0118702.1 hypothetical protein PAE9249_01195 [Paenibacillus sp. CECT 9249]